MKPVYIFTAVLILSTGSLQAANVSSIDEPSVYHAFETIKNKPEATISQRDGWSIVSSTEKGNRVYWFLAPDENNVTPALIKKIIHDKNKDEHDIIIVSECKAPKQKCDALMKQFDRLNKDYK